MFFTDYITGTVITGLGNGHKFGFPTANVQPDIPVNIEKGAYAAWVRYDGKRHKGMLYVGTRPTLNLQEITYEIHIIDASPSLYGKKISFKPVYKIAEEKKFKREKDLINALFDYKGTAKMMLSPSRSHLFNPRLDDINDIMKIIGQAKLRMKKMGLDQWQDGYPDEETIRNDKRKHQAVIVKNWFGLAAYAAIVFGEDPYYEKIDGKWLSDGEPYVTVHRIAVADEFLCLDLARHILRFAERKARARNVQWFRIDTHKDNIPMGNLIRDFGFTFCGVVQVRDGKRMAYEKRVPEKI